MLEIHHSSWELSKLKVPVHYDKRGTNTVRMGWTARDKHCVALD